MRTLRERIFGMIHPVIKALTSRIRGKKLRTKVAELMENLSIIIDGTKHTGLPLNISPAGLSRHHHYIGGYVDHVESTAKIALALCDSVENVYHGKVDRDLVLAGVLLHDVFKPAMYAVGDDGKLGSTRLADYLDHLSLAVVELVRRGFPLELVHIVSAHHGNYGPMKPHTVEALICHLADLMDSRLNGEVMRAASYLTEKAGGGLQVSNSRVAFEIVASKTLGGIEGVAKTIEKLKAERKGKLNRP